MARGNQQLSAAFFPPQLRLFRHHFSQAFGLVSSFAAWRKFFWFNGNIPPPQAWQQVWVLSWLGVQLHKIVFFATEINEVKANQLRQSSYSKECLSAIFKRKSIKSKSSMLTQNANMYFSLFLYQWGLRQEPGSATVDRTVSFKGLYEKCHFLGRISILILSWLI